MSSYTLHVLIDTKDKQDVFRDIKISSEQTLMDLHQVILDAFAFSGQEISSFFSCDDNWDGDQEYTQIAMEPKDEAFEMGRNKISALFKNKGDKAIYQYDFLRMWSFLIELINISPEECPEPTVLLSVGEAPKEEDKEISKDK